MPRENAYDRGKRMLSEGRVVVTLVDGNAIEALVRGDHGDIWHAGYTRGAWRCDCPALSWCGHLFAVALCTTRPGRNPR